MKNKEFFCYFNKYSLNQKKDDADIETTFEQDFELIKKVRKLLLNNINKER